MYHFAWADQREEQGYKSEISLKTGIQQARNQGVRGVWTITPKSVPPKIGPAGPILAAKTDFPLPILVPPVKCKFAII